MNFDQVLRLIEAMNREGVEYITFGAVALNLHGIVRATTDADFFIRPERENIERLKNALRSIWDDPHIDEISAEDMLGDYPSVMYGPPDDTFSIDFLTRLGEAYAYETLPWEVVTYEGVPVRLVTAATLYEMKRNTIRGQDKVDAASLNEKFRFEES